MTERYPVPWWREEGCQEVEEEDLDGAARSFDPGKIDMSIRHLTVGDLAERMRNGEIGRAPDYQRNPNLWNRTLQSRLIESLMMGIPLPSFYFSSEIEDGGADGARQVWRVVDGLQRLSSIRNFLLGSMRLSGLEYLVQFNGASFAELPPTVRRMILEAYVVVILIRSGTPEEIKFNLFKRLNTGGVPLNQQELRHALLHGRGTDFVAELAALPEFVLATGGKVSPRRMMDQELVTRFLAFFILDIEEAYTSMEVFLNDAIRIVNGIGDAALKHVRSIFCATLETISVLMGERAFVRYVPERKDWQTQINKALFETLTVGVARLDSVRQKRLRAIQPSRFMDGYRDLFDGGGQDADSFVSCVSVSTGDRRKVLLRHRIMGEFLNRITEG